MIHKPYPKNNEPRTMGLDPDLLDQLTAWIAEHGIGPNDLLFSTRDGTPISRNTFRTRVWKPAVAAAGVDQTNLDAFARMRRRPASATEDRGDQSSGR